MYKRSISRVLLAASPALLSLSTLAPPASGQGASGAHSRPSAPSTVSSAHSGTIRQTTVSADAAPVRTVALRVAGKTLLPDGKAAARAEVYVSWYALDGKQGFHKIVCDARGGFDEVVTVPANAPGGVISLAALVPGRGIVWQEMPADPAQQCRLELRLRGGATLEGHLVRADGSPAANMDVHLQSLRPHVVSLNAPLPASGDPQITITRSFPHGTNTFSMGRRSILTSGMLPLLPSEALGGLCRATTDAGGKFTLSGVPNQATITLAPADPLVMAAGSAFPIAIQNQGLQNVGVLTTTATGGLKVRVVDKVTGAPASGVTVQVVTSGSLMPAISRLARSGRASFQTATDGAGEYNLPDLLPGEYRVFVPGQTQVVQVKPDGQVTTVEMKARQGHWQGRLLDVDGKPVSNASVQITMRADDASPDLSGSGNMGFNFSSNSVRFAFDGAAINEAQMMQMQMNGFFASRMSQIHTQFNTGPDGGFAFAHAPFGNPTITVRAVRGNDAVEWSGSADKINGLLKLQLRPNVLTSVTGRLVDPQRRPVANSICTALHWLPTPRSTWFATARQVQTDGDGNFHVDGLERGESFSIITTGQNQQMRLARQNAVQQVTPVRAVTAMTQQMGLRAAPVQVGTVQAEDFESPRFVTCRAGDGRTIQNIGEVMVHPSDTPDEVLQSYDGDASGSFPRELPGVLATPPAPAIEEARKSLARWEKAREAGDVNTLHQLAAHVSPGWSADRQEFLLHAGLSAWDNISAEIGETRALRFIPRSTAATLLNAAPPAVRAAMSQIGQGDDALVQQADWLFFARCEAVKPEEIRNEDKENKGGNKQSDIQEGRDSEKAQSGAGGKSGYRVQLAGALHREDGEWRVVAVPNEAIPLGLNIMGRDTPSLTQPAMLGNEEARQAGETYLQTWLSGSKEKLHTLTSPSAGFFAPDAALFRRALEKRADEGVCPLATGEKVALQPVTDMTAWEQEWIKHVVRSNMSNFMATQRMLAQNVANMAQRTNTLNTNGAIGAAGGAANGQAVLAAAPTPAPAPGLAVFRYAAQGHDFLMVMARQKEQWQMVEPALPL